MSQTTPLKRYHAFDSLRATMVLLLIVLHTALCYTDTDLGDRWPYQDTNNSLIFDVICNFILLFLVPIYFVMAGFFAALLYQRNGQKCFIINRVKRILFPFIIGWWILFPLVMLGFFFAQNGYKSDVWELTIDLAFSVKIFANPHMVHLWFLYFLIFYYLIVVLLKNFMNKISIQAIKRLNHLFKKTLQSPWRFIILSIITFLTLLLMEYSPLYSSWSLLPSMQVLLANGVFFTFGWLLYDHKYPLHSFKTNALKQILFSFILFPVYLFSLHELNGSSRQENDMLHFFSASTAALITWLMIFGMTGLFIRIIRQPVPWLRYLSNASYWIYLIHLPIVLLIVGLLSDFNLPAIIKFLIVLASTTIITLITYHFLVKSTLIGLFLTGRKDT